MRVFHVGDVVGKPGRQIVNMALPALRKSEKIDFVVVNGENSAGGSGITPDGYRELLSAGTDCVTLGDHIYRRRQIMPTLRSEERILKPANYPPTSPGRGWTTLKAANDVDVAVISVIGRVFMKPADCPFRCIDEVLAQLPKTLKVIMVDFHAEATSDMQLMGRHLDGRVTSVLGTHTHVPTADEQILPGGTAFQCDIGMTGPYQSILGRRIDRVLETTMTFNPTSFDVAEGDVRLLGTLVELDEATGRATSVKRIELTSEKADKLRRKYGSASED